MAAQKGVAIKTTLLAGKAFEQVLKYARERQPWLLVLGRIGVHSNGDLDLGSMTENLLRLAPCNLLLSARVAEPPAEHVADATMAFTQEAEARMQRVPEFVRGMARKAVIRHAIAEGHTVVTSDVIDACLRSVPSSAMTRPQGGAEQAGPSRAGGGRCPFAHGRPDEAPRDDDEVQWAAEALTRLKAIEPAALREHARLRLEKAARTSGRRFVDAEMMDEAQRSLAQMLR
jgi:hypothetical protein